MQDYQVMSILGALNRIATALEAIAKKADPEFKTAAELAQQRQRSETPEAQE